VWDNVNTHVGARMRRLIETRPWLTVFRLPTYAPDLNPVESVWSHLKRGLGNLAPARSPTSPRSSAADSSRCSTVPPSWTPSWHTPA
ncbi:transposase, partial [Nonomuraea sp. NPDC050547]|uniref:transposase n=1 Tax=Nonomuraea sp. NPDC050547 TaxID=3364368 RepID=UPI00378F2BA1